MPLTFPKLKTGAVAQYPLGSGEAFGNDVLRFVGGDEQRYRTMPSALRNWSVRLDVLDESELAAVEALFVAASGAATTFSFTDPGTGTVYPACYFGADSLEEEFLGESHAGAGLVIRESRS